MMADDERAIRDLIERWLQATREGDVQALLELMTDDVVFMVPGREPFGKAEFAAAMAGMKDVRIDAESDIRELQILDGWAYLRNHLTVTIAPPNAASMRRTGYVLTLLRRQNGRWLIARDANLLT